jgi:Zn-dependent M28 family amino/carboxypeptidase
MRIKTVGRGLCLALLFSSGTLARQATQHDVLPAIADGADSAARAQAITDSLKRAGIQYRLEDFTFPAFSGSNIVADVPGQHAAKTFLLGAHYDRVAQGRGAVDNAASCVVLLDLLARFQSKPLANYNVKAVFFDLEEHGLVGSQAYFAKPRDGERPSFALNLDIFGYGDAFFATGSAVDGPLMAALQQAAKEAAIPVRVVASPNQYPASDHRIMIAAGLETVGLALIDGAEIDAILQRSGPAPRIMTIIHTPEDTIDKVRDDDVAKAVPVVERMIRLIDAR